MTSTVSIPRQSSPPDEPLRPPEDRRHVIRRRALTLLIIVLLVGVPAVYLLICADQSRDSGKDKETRASATGLVHDWPSRILRRLYQVDIPADGTYVAYYETNNWKTSRLYVQFSTSNAGLDEFLAGLGTNAGALKKDDVAIGTHDQGIAGWKFAGRGPWSGLTHAQKNPEPTLAVVVDRHVAMRPMVYVVSRTVP
ncbi:sugar kinase [Streptomyces hygroscopicus]|uniref:sugar kinase n=1 Tax=Streptomyces hygroscopicus TaxID=1912 RepID=UPI002240641D|nr:sugar kinase [Streptomyces hygroscopicus]MCW7944646.1 sugar kinase [Streptomyces hygroscopicus]